MTLIPIPVVWNLCALWVYFVMSLDINSGMIPVWREGRALYWMGLHCWKRWEQNTHNTLTPSQECQPPSRRFTMKGGASPSLLLVNKWLVLEVFIHTVLLISSNQTGSSWNAVPKTSCYGGQQWKGKLVIIGCAWLGNVSSVQRLISHSLLQITKIIWSPPFEGPLNVPEVGYRSALLRQWIFLHSAFCRRMLSPTMRHTHVC